MWALLGMKAAAAEDLWTASIESHHRKTLSPFRACPVSLGLAPILCFVSTVRVPLLLCDGPNSCSKSHPSP
jgi:hypothetical protein